MSPNINHDHFGCISDFSIDGHLHYPNDVDSSLNESVTDKIRKYRDDYNNNPPNTISFIPVRTTSGRTQTDRFFATSGVQFPQHVRDQFHHRAVFSSQFKSKIDNILAKAATLWITLNIDGAPIASWSHTHPSHSQTSLFSIYQCSSPPHNPVYARREHPSALVYCLSSHRHSYPSLLFSS